MKEQKVNIFWFRRDLRLEDNHGLFKALGSGLPLLPLFIFDKSILGKLEDKDDARVTFIHKAIENLKIQLRKEGSDILVHYGDPVEVWKQVCRNYQIESVFCNHDFEPYALKRDKSVSELLEGEGISFQSFKDHVILEKDEVLKDDGAPYTVYTPYSRKWHKVLTDSGINTFPSEKLLHNFLKTDGLHLPGLDAMGFSASKIPLPSTTIPEKIISQYAEKRDYPSEEGTSHLGVHLRFGTISIRKLYLRAISLSSSFVNELVWREFYQMILWHFPHVVEGAFRPKYDQIPWRNNEREFEAWCRGETGFPIVDAGMRELNKTGFMHNRVRMITASFLTKDLLVDWRWGEAYFARHLLDFELASNNGGWQWAAGTGCDAAPYFRIFNPTSQTKKFDPKGLYIKKWVPELDTFDYPAPIVDHAFARKRALEVYKKALQPA